MSPRQLLFLPTKGRFRIFGVLAAGLFALSVAPAMAQALAPPVNSGPAAGLTLQAVGTETGTWSSNPLMVVEGARSLWGSTTSPELVLKDTTPTSLLSLDMKVDKSVFNQPVFDTTDLHAAAGYTTKNERWMAGLQGRTDYDTTRTSELTNYGLNSVVSRHLGFSLAPQISFNPTAVDTLSLAGVVTTSHYRSDTFTNYETFSATPSYTHHFDPLNAGIFSVQAQRYQTTRDNAVKVDSLGPSIGWQMNYSPRFTANVSVGGQVSREYDFGKAPDPWTLHSTFSGGLSFKGEQDTLNLTTARAQSPYGNGTEALQTSFSMTESHALTSLISLNFGANYQTSEYQIASTGNLKSLAGGNFGITLHATETLDLTAGYQYRYETLTKETKTAQDNAVTVGLSYHPNVWTLLQ